MGWVLIYVSVSIIFHLYLLHSSLSLLSFSTSALSCLKIFLNSFLPLSYLSLLFLFHSFSFPFSFFISFLSSFSSSLLPHTPGLVCSARVPHAKHSVEPCLPPSLIHHGVWNDLILRGGWLCWVSRQDTQAVPWVSWGWAWYRIIEDAPPPFHSPTLPITRTDTKHWQLQAATTTTVKIYWQWQDRE